MQVDEMVSLATGENYGLLLKSVIKGEKYFLAVQLKENEEPTDKYSVFKEVIHNDQVCVLEETDPLILSELLSDYNKQMNELED